jgi:hypothetical protein
MQLDAIEPGGLGVLGCRAELVNDPGQLPCFQRTGGTILTLPLTVKASPSCGRSLH